VTGPTWYVGGRLLAALETTGMHVRCLTRRPEALRSRVGGIAPHGSGCEIRQTAFFAPSGISGRASWYAVAPFHQILFPRMLEHIAAAVPTAAGTPEHAGR